MTPFPHTVDVSVSLAEAEALLREGGFHHLPVLDGDLIVGVLTPHDVVLAHQVRDEGNPDKPISLRAAVERVEPLVVDMHDRLDAVLLTMAARRVSYALVTRQGRLAGIITTTDVCRLLAEMLAPADDISPEIA
jgi:acetoin utilization protein AcuB